MDKVNFKKLLLQMALRFLKILRLKKKKMIFI